MKSSAAGLYNPVSAAPGAEKANSSPRDPCQRSSGTCARARAAGHPRASGPRARRGGARCPASCLSATQAPIVDSRSVWHTAQGVLAHILGRLPCPKKTPRKIGNPMLARFRDRMKIRKAENEGARISWISFWEVLPAARQAVLASQFFRLLLERCERTVHQ